MQKVSQCLSTFKIPWEKPMFIQMMQKCSKEPNLGLSICKFYRSDRSRGDFGIGLDLHRLKPGRYIINSFDGSIASAIGQLEWNDKMFKWSYREWAYFIIKIMKKLEINHFKINVSHIMCSYKFIQCPGETKLKEFINKLQIEFDKLYRHNTIKFVVDGGLYTDCALIFDTDPKNTLYKIWESVDFKIDQKPKLKPALTYTVKNEHKIVIDYYGKIYSSEYQYIIHRLFRGKMQNENCAERLYNGKFIAEVIITTHQRAETVYQKCKDLSKLMRKISSKRERYRFNKRMKKCAACSKYDSSSVFVCKCGNLFVCGRKCHKIAWSKRGHRQECKKRIVV